MLFSPHQDLAQQFACNPTRIAGEKSARERPERRHSESVSDVTMGIGRLTQGPMPNKRGLETTRLEPKLDLDRLWRRILGVGHVRRLFLKGPPGLIGPFFMPGADFGDHVTPSVIPADAGLSIHQGPGAMR